MNNNCEWCGKYVATTNVVLAPKNASFPDNELQICDHCILEWNKTEDYDLVHLDFLNDAIWNEQSKIKVQSFRMLKKMDNTWAQSILDMLYLDDSELEWAESEAEVDIVHKDCNDSILQNGDNVTLIKDLKVKGSTLVAKQGTAVRKIKLDPDNAKYIEGKVGGQMIVIIAEYVKMG